MIDGAEEVDDIKICDDDPVARIAAPVDELRQEPRHHQAVGLAPIAIMLGTKSQFIQHKIVEHAAQDVHRLMGDPERAERLDQVSWFVPALVEEQQQRVSKFRRKSVIGDEDMDEAHEMRPQRFPPCN